MSINRIRQGIAVIVPELYEAWAKKKIERNSDELLAIIQEKETAFRTIKEETLHELNLLKNLIEEEQRLRKKIENFPNEFPRWRRDFEILTSIPGISAFRAVVLISSYIDISRFKSFKAFKKYMGFVKSDEQSGTSLKRQVRKVSNREVRRELYMLFLWLARKNVPESALPMAEYRRNLLKKTGGITKKAFWKFSDKLLRVIWHLLHTGEKYDPQKWGYTPDDVMGLDPGKDVGEKGSTKGGKEVSYGNEKNQPQVLKLKPPDMGLTEWIREAIHTWRLVKSGELEMVLSMLEELRKTGKELVTCPNLEALKEIVERLKKDIKALEKYSDIVERLEMYTDELYEMKKRLEAGLIYRPRLWERSYSWEDEEEEGAVH